MYKCYICKEHKPAENFHKDKTRGSGLSSKCKDCRKTVNKAKRKTPEGKIKRVIDSRKWKRNNKEKEKAHKKVAEAIRSGRLLKPTGCTRCASRLYVQGHHPDYSKPLEVVWLCRDCHLNHHKEVWSAAR